MVSRPPLYRPLDRVEHTLRLVASVVMAALSKGGGYYFWDIVAAIAFWTMSIALCVSTILLFGVWREVRMVLHVLNGACLP